jgi:TPR repeat protein
MTKRSRRQRADVEDSTTFQSRHDRERRQPIERALGHARAGNASTTLGRIGARVDPRPRVFADRDPTQINSVNRRPSGLTFGLPSRQMQTLSRPRRTARSSPTRPRSDGASKEGVVDAARRLAAGFGVVALLATQACVRLGPLHVETTTKLCKEQGPMFCTLLGDGYLRATWTSLSDTWGMGIDKDNARDAYLKACDRGEKSACARLLEFRLLTDTATIARVEGQLQGKELRSDEAIERDLEDEMQKADDFDAKVAADTPGAAEYLGAASTALGQQSSVAANPKTAKAFKDASKLTGAAADVAKTAEDAEAAKGPRRRPPGEGHRLLLARRGAGPAPSISLVADAPAGPPVAPPLAAAAPQREDPTPPAAAPGGAGVPAGPASEAELARQALAASTGDKTAAFTRKQCRDKPAECFSLASGYSNGSFDLPKDASIGLALYQRACEGGELNGCVMVLNIVFTGTNGVTKDAPRAKAMARSTCGRGSASACFSLARVMQPKPDEKQYAEEQLAKQCEAGDANGCHYLVSGDYKSARGKHMLQQLESICQQKKGAACTYLDSYRKQGNIP